ncbi:hypothetical protein CPU05_07310 [Pediococcus acidilactici]|nr:hypothetical protein CPU05_07310 [Pediococcus acidilactici]
MYRKRFIYGDLGEKRQNQGFLQKKYFILQISLKEWNPNLLGDDGAFITKSYRILQNGPYFPKYPNMFVI